jgi:hypothetical protein
MEQPYVNRCIICHVDMGEMNPRQYCMKIYCPMEETLSNDQQTLSNKTTTKFEEEKEEEVMVDK